MFEMDRQGAGQVWLCHDLDYLRGLEARYRELLGSRELPGPEAVQKMQGVSKAGAIVVLPVFGMIVQHPSWLTYYGLATSVDQLRAEIAAAQADPQVAGVLLRINSGGGSVNGLVPLAATMRAARGTFPIWGHADSYALSAAQWILASCGRAFATPLGFVGSIGVLYEHCSYAGQDEKEGRKRTLVKLPARKAETWEGADLEPEAKAHIEAMALLAYNAFVADVAKGRGVSASAVRSDEWGQGAMLDAGAGAGVGLLDGVQSFDETLVQMAKAIRSGKATTGAGAEDEPPATPEEPLPDPQPEPVEPAAKTAAADPELLKLHQRFF